MGPTIFVRREFAQKYDLCYYGLNLKQVKVLKYCTKEDVTKVFGPIMNKNAHSYMECAVSNLIAKIENLWMIIHQKLYLLAGRVIILGMAKGLIYEFNGKQMNWATYVKWMSQKQFRQRHAKDPNVGD